MNTLLKYNRSLLIAAQNLMRCIPKIEIRRAYQTEYDLIASVYHTSLNLWFGIKVVSSSFIRTKSYQDYLNDLDKALQEKVDVQIPILVMSVNENAETALIGAQIGWRFGYPEVHRNPSLIAVNVSNTDKIISLLMTLNEDIRLLSSKNIKVKKTLSFHYELNENALGQVDIVYLRDFSESYKMKTKQATNRQERFKQLCSDIPKENYPNDELDDMILAMVKEKFPDTKTHNHLLVCSNELRDLQTLKNVYSFNFRLLITPNTSTLPQTMLPLLKGLECISFTLSAFTVSDKIKDCLSDYEFSKEVDFSGWLNTYNKIEQGLKTLHQPSEYFI